jgi:hypothetical protein
LASISIKRVLNYISTCIKSLKLKLFCEYRETKINRNHFHHLPSDLCRLNGHEKCIQLLNSNFSTSSLDMTVSKKIKINIVPILKIDNDTLLLNKSPRSSPPFLISNYSLNNQTSTTNDIMSDELQLILKCRKRLLSTYKLVFSLKESLIKVTQKLF